MDLAGILANMLVLSACSFSNTNEIENNTEEALPESSSEDNTSIQEQEDIFKAEMPVHQGIWQVSDYGNISYYYEFDTDDSGRRVRANEGNIEEFTYEVTDEENLVLHYGDRDEYAHFSFGDDGKHLVLTYKDYQQSLLWVSHGTLEDMGSETDEMWSTCSGTVWFVDDDTCETVQENESFFVYGNKVIDMVNVDGHIFAHTRVAYATSTVSYLYYVKDGNCRESEISGLGSFFKPDYADGYSVSVSAYDYCLDYDEGKESEGLYTGHTWKHYYFYYDEETEDFNEYVGTPITESELASMRRQIAFSMIVIRTKLFGALLFGRSSLSSQVYCCGQRCLKMCQGLHFILEEE